MIRIASVEPLDDLKQKNRKDSHQIGDEDEKSDNNRKGENSNSQQSCESQDKVIEGFYS